MSGILILDLTPGFNIFHKDNCKMSGETFKFLDLVRLILEFDGSYTNVIKPNVSVCHACKGHKRTHPFIPSRAEFSLGKYSRYLPCLGCPNTETTQVFGSLPR